MDNLWVHHAKVVQAWLGTRTQRIEVFYLPPYTPEVNPDGFINRDSKTELRSKPAAKSVEAPKRLALDFMACLGAPSEPQNWAMTSLESSCPASANTTNSPSP